MEALAFGMLRNVARTDAAAAVTRASCNYMRPRFFFLGGVTCLCFFE